MALRFSSFLVLLLMAAPQVWAQVPQTPPATNGGLGPYEEMPQLYPIRDIQIEGVEQPNVVEFIRESSGLEIGQTVSIPGDPAFTDAIRNIYTSLGMFSDVKVLSEKTETDSVNITIRVQEEPTLAEVTYVGMKKGHREEVQDKLGLLQGRAVKPSDLEQVRQVIQDYYAEKGFLLTEVTIDRTVSNVNNTVDLEINVDRGPRVEVSDIIIQGNEDVSDRSVQRRLKETNEDRWWRFWKKATFDEDEYEADLQRVIDYYNERGYYDARIVEDSTYIVNEGGEPGVAVELTIHEGPQYHIRDIEWEGNTVYPDVVLTNALGFETGEVYNRTQLEQNLFANRASTDIASLYMNRGYMKFNVQPNIRVVEGDSLDITFDITEGDVYTFGNITIEGNTKTKEHVIRRELYTVPGQTFSRESIQESIRRLSQLSYFNQEALATGPQIQIDETNKEVDLTYVVEEVGSDQLELSGTWGRYGLILMLRFGFNNFSAQNIFNGKAWRPLPSGDGQKLSVGIQTNGRYYQSYSLSFTEPWFRGRPTPVGFALSHSRYSRFPFRYGYGFDSDDDNDGGFITSSVRGFFERRLKWPDDYFNSSTSLNYQYYLNHLYRTLPEGVSQELSVEQAFRRSSVDNPTFPTRGSDVTFSLRVAPPIPGFIQYHKWRFQSAWNLPLADKLSIGVGTDLGYVGSLTGDPVTFERFELGGSPFDTQGLYRFGTDIVYMRGYPRAVLTPRRDGEIVGGTILNKFTSELRWLAVQTPQLQAAPYLFMDAANTWDSFVTYNPAELYRSAGLGIRLMLPIVGMLELTYGYNFDEFTPLPNDNKHTGEQKWYFQFSLGQGFN